MRRVVRTAALALTLAAVATGVALASGGLSGTFKTTIKGDSALGGQLNGTWTIKFKNGTYHVTSNGHAVTHGRFAISGKDISLTDTGGTAKCNGTGTYKFKLSGSTLKFTKLMDTKSCIGRQGVLSHPFTKVT
jgi:hypothetical protein